MAIALARGLNSSEYRVAPAIEPSGTPVQALVAESGNLTVEDRYDRQWIRYATVSRSDGSFRHMFVSPEDASRISPGQPLPEDTLIIMETWYSPQSPGTVFIKQNEADNGCTVLLAPVAPIIASAIAAVAIAVTPPFPKRILPLPNPYSKPLCDGGYCNRPIAIAPDAPPALHPLICPKPVKFYSSELCIDAY